MRHTNTDEPRTSYEPPELRLLGTLHELTLNDFCILGKSLGKPDFFNRIPISNCSG